MNKFEQLFNRLPVSLTCHLLLGVLFVHAVIIPLLFATVLHVIINIYEQDFSDYLDDYADVVIYSLQIHSTPNIDDVPSHIRKLIKAIEVKQQQEIVFRFQTSEKYPNDKAYKLQRLQNHKLWTIYFNKQALVKNRVFSTKLALAVIFSYVVLAFLVVFYLRRTLVDPLISLRHSSARVAAGNFDVQLNVASSLPELVGLANDLNHMRSELVQQTAALQYEALHDTLTHLPNRGATQEVIEREHARCLRHQGSYTLMLFDLDHFKSVNDNYGHNAGDEVLVSVAKIALNTLREADTVGRWGGEEFLCVFPDMPADQALVVAQRLRKEIETTTICAEQHELNVTISAGLACYPNDGESIDKLLQTADNRLYEAKRSGRNRVICQYTEKDNDGSSIASKIELALQQGRIHSVFQPIVAAQTCEIVAYEAFARICLEADQKMLVAEKFIESAIQLNLIHKIDQEVILQTIVHCQRLMQTKQKMFKFFVNISPDLLRYPETINKLIENINEECKLCNIKKPLLVIELSEKHLTKNISVTRTLLMPFIDAGVELAIDDFGCGQLSFHYLAELPATYLRIDTHLIQRLDTDKKAQTIVKGIQSIADGLEVTTIAGYIENDKTFDILRDLGVHWVQGYQFGRPE